MKKLNIKNNILIAFSFIMVAIISQIILLHSHMLFPINDMQFQMRRINELIIASKHLNLSPFAFNQFNGSAVMSFYPYFTLLPITIVYYFIKSKIVALYVFLIINTFVSLMISLYSNLNISNNFWTSYVFSIVYSLSTVFMGYDLGMTIAMSYLPLVVFGFIHLINSGHYLELVFGMILITFSHVLSTIIAAIFITVLLLINYKRWSIKLFSNILKSIFIYICITSILWIPMAYISLTNNINLPALNNLQGLPINEMIKSFFGGADEMGLGTFVIIAIILSLFFWRKFTDIDKQFYIISIITIFICSKLFPWKLINYTPISIFLSHFQFSYRFLIIPILLLSYLFSVIISKYISRKHLSYALIIISLLLSLGLRLVAQEHAVDKYSTMSTFTLADKYKPNYFRIMNNSQLNKFVKYDPDNLSKLSSGVDYYPKSSLDESNYINNNGVHEGIYNHNHIIKVYHQGYNTLTFDNKLPLKTLRLPLLLYNKENLSLRLDGHVINHYSNVNNMINISNVSRGYHKLHIVYIHKHVLILLEICMYIMGISYMLFDYLKDKLNKEDV